MAFYNNNFYFQSLLLRTFLITKLNISSSHILPQIERIKCNIQLNNLRTLTDSKILDLLETLELISTKKPKITKISSGFFKNIENLVQFESNLVKGKLWNFLTYYNYFLKPISKSKKLNINIKILEDKVFIFIEDISLFAHLEEKFLKEKLPLFLEIKFKKGKFPNEEFKNILKYIFI